LSVRSKLNRDPGFIRDLIAHGRAQAEEFLTALAFERAWQEGDPEKLLGFFSEDVEFVSRQPFPKGGPGRGVQRVADFLSEHLSGLVIDANKKHVAGDSVTWTVKLESDGARLRAHGMAEIALNDTKITSLRLGPSA
jgi:NTE family protein